MTKMIMKPFESVRVLQVDGSSGKASNLARRWHRRIELVEKRRLKRRRNSPARLATAINTMRGKERVQIEKPECPKLGGATGSLANTVVRLCKRNLKGTLWRRICNKRTSTNLPVGI